jgi:hypothetical protein
MKYGIQQIKVKRGERVHALLICLADPKSLEYFVEFSQTEYAIENISRWQEVQEYKANRSKRESLAEHIFITYLNGNASVMEINTSQVFCQSVREKMRVKDFNDHLFYDIEEGLKGNLADTWIRFVLWGKWKIQQQE